MTTQTDQHTPGPWHFVEGDATEDHHVGGGIISGTPPAFVDGVVLATIWRELPAYAANARLIASAPELLAALESIVDHIANAGMPKVLTAPARAAIAKARGTA